MKLVGIETASSHNDDLSQGERLETLHFAKWPHVTTVEATSTHHRNTMVQIIQLPGRILHVLLSQVLRVCKPGLGPIYPCGGWP